MPCMSALAALSRFTLQTPRAIIELKRQITFGNFLGRAGLTSQ